MIDDTLNSEKFTQRTNIKGFIPINGRLYNVSRLKIKNTKYIVEKHCLFKCLNACFPLLNC